MLYCHDEYMALSAAALLDLIENAIVALTTGGSASYSIGSRTVTKLDLGQLFIERRILLREVHGGISLGTIGGRRR